MCRFYMDVFNGDCLYIVEAMNLMEEEGLLNEDGEFIEDLEEDLQEDDFS